MSLTTFFQAELAMSKRTSLNRSKTNSMSSLGWMFSSFTLKRENAQWLFATSQRFIRLTSAAANSSGHITISNNVKRRVFQINANRPLRSN